MAFCCSSLRDRDPDPATEKLMANRWQVVPRRGSTSGTARMTATTVVTQHTVVTN